MCTLYSNTEMIEQHKNLILPHFPLKNSKLKIFRNLYFFLFLQYLVVWVYILYIYIFEWKKTTKKIK